MAKLVENPKEEWAVLECKKIFEKRYKFSSYAKSMEPYYVACFLRGFELGKKAEQDELKKKTKKLLESAIDRKIPMEAYERQVWNEEQKKKGDKK